MVAAIAPHLVSKVTICSPSKASATVEKLASGVKDLFELVAEDNQENLIHADMVVAATSNREHHPSVIPSKHSMKLNIVVVALATNELPDDFVEHLLSGNGLTLCDNIQCVSERNHQSLALYFTKRGTTLLDQVAGYNIYQFCDLMTKQDCKGRRRTRLRLCFWYGFGGHRARRSSLQGHLCESQFFRAHDRLL